MLRIRMIVVGLVLALCLLPSAVVAQQGGGGGGGGGGSGTVNANSGNVGACAFYAAAGGSTTVGPDTNCTDNGTNIVFGEGLVFSGAGGAATTISTSAANAKLLLSPNGTGTVGFNNGAVGTPSISFAADATSGLWSRSAHVLSFSISGIDTVEINTSTINLSNSGTLAWTSGSLTSTGGDTGLSRSTGAGIVAVGNATQGDTSGKLKAAGYMSVGTTFTSNAGCTDSSLTGGATAGKFTVGQSTACTTIITMGNSATAPNGWTCTAYDQTNVPTAAIRQTATTTTSCSLSMTVTSSDVIVFSAIGW